MHKLSKAQAQELIGLLNESNFADFFEKLGEFGVETYEVGVFKKEFISDRYDWAFSERLQAYVNSIAHTSFTLENPKFDIFFSFSSKNKATAENAVALLRKAGLTVFFSYDDLQQSAGSEFLRKINDAIRNSQHLVLLCTPEAMQAAWVRHEYETFYSIAFIPSKKQRRLFILEGEGFDRQKLAKDDLLHSIQTSPNVESILKVLGKELPKADDLPERKLEYKELFEICFADGKISEKERKQLDKKQKGLALTDKQVAEIEAEVRQEVEAEKTVVLALADTKRREEEEKLRKIEEAVRKQDWDTWQRVIYDNNLDAYRYYLGLFPEGMYAKEAKEKITQLSTIVQPATFFGEMVFVKGGTYQMGYAPNRDGKDDDYMKASKPLHTVQVEDFYIGKYPVTQAQWQEIMGTNPSHFKGDNLPVENVYWDDIQEFLTKLNAKFPPVGGGGGYRLPTEEEWEYAARGGNQSKSYQYAGSNKIEEVAWYYGNSGNKTHPVGQKSPNELGIYDMSGNVWEWCADWYKGYAGSSGVSDYTGSARVVRGGSWRYSPVYCRVANRRSYGLYVKDYDLGFRLYRTR